MRRPRRWPELAGLQGFQDQDIGGTRVVILKGRVCLPPGGAGIVAEVKQTIPTLSASITTGNNSTVIGNNILLPQRILSQTARNHATTTLFPATICFQRARATSLRRLDSPPGCSEAAVRRMPPSRHQGVLKPAFLAINLKIEFIYLQYMEKLINWNARWLFQRVLIDFMNATY